MERRLNSALALAAALLSGVLPSSARAAERVTLRNGFVQFCNHHAQVQGRMRLYLTAGEDNYIEFAAPAIATIEHVPDPPDPPSPSSSPGTASAAVATPARAAASAQPPSPAILNPADLHEMLARAGQAHDLDVDLLASVVKAESGGNTQAVSRAGAQGLMQLMPQTAAQLGVHNSFAPEDNVRGGSAYLDALLTHYKDNLALALAAYNAGPAAVDKYHGIPPYAETRAYVARVIHEFNRRVLAREAEARRAVQPQAQPASQGASSQATNR
jgi:soluble lytic murein transglycosylase-like protein